MGRRRVLTAVGYGAGLLSLVSVSVVFACSNLTPAAYVAGPSQATAGSSVTVTTHNMSAMGPATASSPSRIIWADANNNWVADLAPAPDTDASVAVTIPATASPGDYFINVFRGTSRATPTRLTIPAPSTGTGSTGSPANSTTPVYNGFTTTPSTTSTSTTPTTSSHAGTGTGTVKGGSSGAAPASTTSGVPIPGAIRQQPGPGANEPDTKVLGDLWGAFRHGATTSRAPSLIPAAGSGPGIGLTAGLLVGGLVALVAGVGIVEVRRKRSTSPLS